VDAALIQEARSKIALDGSMAPVDFLLYTRALMPSLQPEIPQQSPFESFEWVVVPEHSADTTGCCIYIDGSFLFSEARYCGLVARRGWALAVSNAADELIASARGRPPQWVGGIHGSELWSLLQALQLGMMQSRIFTDCMAVLLGARRGETWANESRRTFSRLWGPVSAALEGDADALLWLPAHCTGAQVDSRQLSNGAPMRQKHPIGYAAVDTLAKSSANDDRLPLATLKLIAAKGDKVTTIAMFIGRCTRLANHFPDTRGNPESKPNTCVTLRVWLQPDRRSIKLEGSGRPPSSPPSLEICRDAQDGSNCGSESRRKPRTAWSEPSRCVCVCVRVCVRVRRIGVAYVPF
jgi:hypothetical protein